MFFIASPSQGSGPEAPVDRNAEPEVVAKSANEGSAGGNVPEYTNIQKINIRRGNGGPGGILEINIIP